MMMMVSSVLLLASPLLLLLAFLLLDLLHVLGDDGSLTPRQRAVVPVEKSRPRPNNLAYVSRSTFFQEAALKLTVRIDTHVTVHNARSDVGGERLRKQCRRVKAAGDNMTVVGVWG